MGHVPGKALLNSCRRERLRIVEYLRVKEKPSQAGGFSGLGRAWKALYLK
jgi:hypothetical protein